MCKNKIQKISIVALTGLIAGASALAFLNTSEVQSGTNMIKPGQISIMFDNETDAIVLSQNTAIPMSDDYAKANLVSYKFDIVNDGDIDLDYAVYADNINSTFDTAKIDIMLKDGAGEMTYVGTLEQINKDAAGRIALVSKENVAPNDTHSYELIAHIDGSVSLNDYTGKTASFGLKVEAEQAIDAGSAPVIEDLTTEVKLRSNELGDWVRFRVKSVTFNYDTKEEGAAMKARFTSFKINDNEIVDTDYFIVAALTTTGSAGLDAVFNETGVVSNPNYVVEGTNTYSFVFDGVTYSGTFEYTPA